MRYVDDRSLRKVFQAEEKIRELPSEAGVLFVSVKAEPIEGGDAKRFSVCLGMPRRFDEGTGTALVKHVLKDILTGCDIDVRVLRGVTGACRDDGAGSTCPAAS